MRQAVVVLNTLSIIAAVLVAPIALYIGAWGLLGPAYDRPQDLVLGLAIMAAPIVVTGLCVFFSIRSMRRGRNYAPFIAAMPLLVAILGYLSSPFAAAF
ncbi:MAG: hypothetical protein EPN45_18565 [Rhizobiaceae bacterium]|jgi:hypothetical protein|nr:MAG: hypothetical protein EPN45_18565 [Rhizobiaceae bacterium]